MDSSAGWVSHSRRNAAACLVHAFVRQSTRLSPSAQLSLLESTQAAAPRHCLRPNPSAVKPSSTSRLRHFSVSPPAAEMVLSTASTRAVNAPSASQRLRCPRCTSLVASPGRLVGAHCRHFETRRGRDVTLRGALSRATHSGAGGHPCRRRNAFSRSVVTRSPNRSLSHLSPLISQHCHVALH